MSAIVGIDLGTTNSLVAVVDSGIPLVLADDAGRRLTPSIVHYPAGGGEPLIGEAARRVRALRAESTVSSVKRLIGRRLDELSPDERNCGYPLRRAANGGAEIPLAGKAVMPEEVSAEVLRTLRRIAGSALGTEVTRAVITVPAYFNDAQRNATKRAGELAGLTVERILNEPTAAALAYGLNRLKDRAKIAVYDLGGGTFDLSILELHEGVFQVLSTSGNTRLGGDDLDRRVVEWLETEIRNAGGPDTAAFRQRLVEAAEQAKIQLSTVESVEISLPFLTPEFSFQTEISRHRLEQLTRDLILRTREHCLRALADAKLGPEELDQIILVGGQTRMPLVRHLVSEWFRCVEFDETRGSLRVGEEFHRAKGPQLNTSVNPDEAVALGAAIQAEILAGGFKNMLLLDVTPLSLGIETFGGLMNVIIPRNSTIPARAGEVFTTAVDSQRSMLIHVLQGERERAKDNWSLGRFDIEFDPAPKGVPRVGVQFEIDANGILHVLARDIATGRQKVVPMKSAVDVDDAAVQRMVEESVEHAWEDMAARRWIEAKLRAEETLAASRNGLETIRAELDPSLVTEVENAMAAVTAVLTAENPESKTGDVDRLKAAHAALDRATQPLAELLMERAMEAMLQRRGLV